MSFIDITKTCDINDMAKDSLVKSVCIYSKG